MKYTELQKRYPELWAIVYDQVESELKDEKLDEKVIKCVAHNAAFMACNTHNDMVKEIK